MKVFSEGRGRNPRPVSAVGKEQKKKQVNGRVRESCGLKKQ